MTQFSNIRETKQGYSFVTGDDKVCMNARNVDCMDIYILTKLFSFRAGKPPPGLHLDVMKGDKLMEVTEGLEMLL